MKTYTFPERRPTLKGGPWEKEPDKAQWIDEATDLDCLMVRNPFGALCGYVGVQPGHPWHGKDYSDELLYDVSVHGGLTYADFCQEGAEDGPGICHVPGPGRPANVWWLGFDCAHFMDLVPALEEHVGSTFKTLTDLEKYMKEEAVRPYGKTYRTFEYVQNECRDLAKQIREAG